MPSKQCGPHTELCSNDALRVSRCTCGTVHLTLIASGVTLRLSAEQLRGVAAGLKMALERLDEASSQLGTTSIN